MILYWTFVPVINIIICNVSCIYIQDFVWNEHDVFSLKQIYKSLREAPKFFRNLGVVNCNKEFDENSDGKNIIDCLIRQIHAKRENFLRF